MSDKVNESLTLTFGSLFAGIGGFDLGLERAGMVCKWQVEIDEFCRRVLTKHWSDVPKFGDIRDCGKHNLEAVDVICGGFPCQPFSAAGKRRGAADDRYLWPEMLRIISELKPTWVVGENVAGFISMGLDSAVADLEATGYEVQPLVLPACGVNAPHQRYRVFIVAHAKSDNGTRGNITKDFANGSGWESRKELDTNYDDARFMAHADSRRRPQCETGERGLPEFDANGNGIGITNAPLPNGLRWQTKHDDNGHNANGQTRWQPIAADSALGDIGDFWRSEPGVRRVADGIPNVLDRLRCLGNAVVPQLAEVIGKAIMEVEQYE